MSIELQGSWQRLLHILKIAFKLKFKFQSLAFPKNNELMPFYYKRDTDATSHYNK